MAQIKIRVGAVRDRSVDAVFSSIETRAIRSANVIRRAMQGAVADGLGKGARGGRGPGSGGMSPEEREAKRIADAKIREERRVQREIERNARWRQAMQNRHFQQEAALRLRQQRRESALADRDWRNFKERTSHRATRFLTPNAPIGSMATRALGDFARGAGVDFSIAGSVSRAVGLETAAINLSNSGYQRGAEGPNGRRVDPRDLVAQARGVASTYGLEAADTLDGLAQFQKITGDLDTGRKMLDGMAKLSAATGTNLGEMAAAAANVSNGLGDIPNKSAAVEEVMRTIAGQGKKGAVEISDLAVHMSKLASPARMFEGDVVANMKKLGALAQMARSFGGSTSAADATTGVASFVTTFKKNARYGAFKSKGIELYNEKQEIRDPITLIKEALLATGGKQTEMNKLFMDVRGFKAVAGAMAVFNKAGGGTDGLKAVEAEFSKFLEGAEYKQEAIDEDARIYAQSQAAKAKRFQNQLDQIVEKVSQDLIPALEKASPSILKFAQTLGDIASFAVENPIQAALYAIGASIARAGVESLFRTAVEKAFDKAGQQFVGFQGKYDRNAGFGGGLGAMGNITAALTIATLAITTVKIGEALIDKFFDNSKETDNKALLDDVSNEALSGEVLKAINEGNYEKAIELQRKKTAQDEQDVATTEDKLNNPLTRLVDSLMEFDAMVLGGGFKDNVDANDARRASDAQRLQQQKEEAARSHRLLEELIAAVKESGKGSGGDGVDRASPPMPGGSGRN